MALSYLFLIPLGVLSYNMPSGYTFSGRFVTLRMTLLTNFISRRSLGVLLYNMLSGYRPFAGRSDEETCRAVQAGEFDLKVRAACDADLGRGAPPGSGDHGVTWIWFLLVSTLRCVGRCRRGSSTSGCVQGEWWIVLVNFALVLLVSILQLLIVGVVGSGVRVTLVAVRLVVSQRMGGWLSGWLLSQNKHGMPERQFDRYPQSADKLSSFLPVRPCPWPTRAGPPMAQDIR